MRKLILILGCIIACSENARCQSTLITFDDISAVEFGNTPPNAIPNGYQGFNWNNFAVINTTSFPESGILNGTVSGPNVAVSLTGGFPTPQSYTATLSSADPFILVSGYFASAFQNGMSLEITGMNGSTTEFDETFTLNVTGPSLLTFPADDITEVNFNPSGGTSPGQGYLDGAPEMVLDNLTLEAVPEPSAWALMAGAGLLGLLQMRRNA